MTGFGIEIIHSEVNLKHFRAVFGNVELGIFLVVGEVGEIFFQWLSQFFINNETHAIGQVNTFGVDLNIH